MPERLDTSGFDIIDQGLRLTWTPDDESKLAWNGHCFDYKSLWVERLKKP